MYLQERISDVTLDKVISVYDGINPRCPKNSLSFSTPNGREYKGPVGLFVRKATAEDIARCDSRTGKL